MGLFGVPLIPYFLRFPLPPSPGEAWSKWLQLTRASFSPTTPPQLSSLSPKRRGLETQGQTYHSPRLTGGKTHKPGVGMLAGESPNSQHGQERGPPPRHRPLPPPPRDPDLFQAGLKHGAEVVGSLALRPAERLPYFVV